MAHFQNEYGAAHSTDAYNVIRKDEYGNVIPTDEYGNPIRHNGTTLQGGQQQQQQRQDLSTEYDGQGGRRNIKGLKEKITENIPVVGNNGHRNDTSSATTDAYDNVIRKDEYGNVIPTDKYGNPIRHSGTTNQGGQHQQQRHDLSTEYDGQGGRRNKGLKEKITENIPGVGNNDNRNDTISSATTDAYGNPIRHNGTTLQDGQQQQQRHDLSTEYDGQGGRRNKGLKEKITENIPGVANNDHRNDISSATIDAYGNVICKDEYGNVIPTDEYGNLIRHSGTNLQGGQQQQRHDLSTEYNGQGGGRNKGLKEKITAENIAVVGNNDHRNDTSSATTDAYGNIIRKDEYGNVNPTDEYSNAIRHSGTTLQGGRQRQQQQQQRHDLCTEYDGQGGRRNKGLKEKITENIPGVGNNDHRNDISSATTDAYGNVICKDEYGNVIPTDEYGNLIRHSGTTLQGGQQQQRHDLSTEYNGQGGGRNKGLMEKITEDIRPGVGNNNHRNDTSSATIDAYGNVIRKDEYGNVNPTDEYDNPIRHSGTTLQGGRQQQQRHDLSTEYNGQGGRRNKGLKEKMTEDIPGVGNNNHRNDTSSATIDAYGNVIRKDEYGNVIPTDEYGNLIRHSQGGQQQQRHDLSTEYVGQGGRRNKGLKENITENIPGVGNNDHRNDTLSATTDAYGNVIRKDEDGKLNPTDEYGNPIRHSGTTLQGGQQQQQRHDVSTEYDGQGGRRNKGLKEKITENIPVVGNNDHRNDTSSATTDAYGNVIRKDEYDNVNPTDEYGNPIRHSGTTLQGGQQLQQRHDVSTEYDGQGGRRNKGLKEKVTENIPGVGNKDHRNDTSSATTTTPTTTASGYGTGEQAHVTENIPGVGNKDHSSATATTPTSTASGYGTGEQAHVTENIPGVGNKDHRNDTSSATATTPTTTASGYRTGEQAQHHQHAEKKGVMEKIKEKVRRCV